MYLLSVSGEDKNPGSPSTLTFQSLNYVYVKSNVEITYLNSIFLLRFAKNMLLYLVAPLC